MEGKVPAQFSRCSMACALLPSVSLSAWRRISCARRRISCAARRVKVSSRMRAGSTPFIASHATRCAMVLVLPVPAPATTRSGPARTPLPSWSGWPKVTALRCGAFSVASRSTAGIRRIYKDRPPMGYTCGRSRTLNLAAGTNFGEPCTHEQQYHESRGRPGADAGRAGTGAAHGESQRPLVHSLGGRSFPAPVRAAGAVRPAAADRVGDLRDCDAAFAGLVRGRTGCGPVRGAHLAGGESGLVAPDGRHGLVVARAHHHRICPGHRHVLVLRAPAAFRAG